MPVYNVDLFVGEAIESVLVQSYKNFELIIVNDGSTDDTGSIIDKYSKLDSRVKVYHFTENQRIVHALNFGLSICKGDFIARMDGDDRSVGDRLEIMYNYLIEHPEISLVGCNMEIINEVGFVVGKSELIQEYSCLLKVLKFASPVPHIWLCKRSVYEVVGNYRLAGAEDYDFLLRMVSKNMKFTNIPDFLYQVRIREGNTSTSIGFIQFSHARLAYKLFVERRKFSTEKTEWNDNDVLDKFSKKNELVSNAFNFLRISLMRLKNKELIVGLYYLTRSIFINPQIILFVLYQRIGFHFLQRKYKNK
jgi:glycosyltransferase involved in cell wall biosynthesis